MNNFIKASNNEREHMINLFKKTGIKEYTFTDSKGFDSYDGSYIKQSTGRETMFEVKVRKVKSTQYSTTVIESVKFEALKKLHLETGNEIYLFIFFSDNKYLAHPLDFSYNYIKSLKFSPKITAYHSNKVQKEFIEIEIPANLPTY